MPRPLLTEDQRQVLRDRLSHARLISAKNRSQRKRDRLAGIVAPVTAPGNVSLDPVTRGLKGQPEINIGSVVEAAQGLPSQAREALLDSVGYTLPVRQRELKLSLACMKAGLNATKSILTRNGLVAVPDFIARAKFAEMYAKMLAPIASIQPQALRMKHRYEFVRADFAKPAPIVETDAEVLSPLALPLAVPSVVGDGAVTDNESPLGGGGGNG